MDTVGGVLIVIAIVGSVSLVAWWLERRSWNNGVCRCGGSLQYFDADSQGGRGYICAECECCVWVSWPFIDHR